MDTQISKVRNEDRAAYLVKPVITEEEADDLVIAEALRLVEQRTRNSGDVMQSPTQVKQWLTLRYSQLEHEVFSCLWLTAQNQVIALEELSRGTLICASVYPREVVKAALKANAANVILCHNHPSGLAEPSQADLQVTQMLKEALKLVDVTVIEHVIVAGVKMYSFAEHGLII